MAPIPLSRDRHPQEALQQERTARVRDAIAASLTRDGARPVTVAAHQMRNRCGGEAGKRENLERMLRAVEQAHGEGVRLLAFPEMCLPGYFTPLSGSVDEAVRANRDLADVVGESDFLRRLREAAAAARMVLVFGFGERDGDVVHNSAGVIDADGRWLGVRRKNPLYPWPYELESFAEPPRARRSTVFDTGVGRIGVAICFDGEFPESVRQMRRDGAELLVWINAACGDATIGTSNRLNAAGAHAQNNGLWVICCNCVAPNASGTSSIYAPHGEALVVLSPDREQIGVATLDLALETSWDSVWRDRVVRRVEPDGARG